MRESILLEKVKLFSLILILSLLPSFLHPAYAQVMTTRPDALCNPESKEFQESFKKTTEDAENGSLRAQRELAIYYQVGDCVKQDYAEAEKWFLRAAETGDVEAEWSLGEFYLRTDPEKAMKWWRKAAESNAQKQEMLGRKYLNGDFTKQDYAEAAKWFRKSADQGDTDSQNILGQLYNDGQGVELNYSEAYFWFSLASQGHDPGILWRRRAAAKHLTQDQRASADRRAQEWKPTLESAGFWNRLFK